MNRKRVIIALLLSLFTNFNATVDAQEIARSPVEVIECSAIDRAGSTAAGSSILPA
ncbi:MAG: hypothetical protein J5J00_04880 [Deltaproteobacteria bacterium]|nr:hypothetical protein [Deltaproteobacteria bacterium]